MESKINNTEELKLGIIGMSEGNGHPYSWSAIINGYDPIVMEECPFPVIPDYLAKQRFPDDQLDGARVTHIWTQEKVISSHISRACLIPNIVNDFEEMVGNVDAILLARDDAEQHQKFASPFLKNGIPIYLDKPPALTIKELDKLFALAIKSTQIFSCSALRYAKELSLTAEELDNIGPIQHVIGVTPKSWDRYAIHVIDPIISFLQPGQVIDEKSYVDDGSVNLSIRWESGYSGLITSTGEASGEIALTYVGKNTSIKKVFKDPFIAFRNALEAFLKGVRMGYSDTPYEHLKNIVELVEMGRRKTNA